MTYAEGRDNQLAKSENITVNLLPAPNLSFSIPGFLYSVTLCSTEVLFILLFEELSHTSVSCHPGALNDNNCLYVLICYLHTETDTHLGVNGEQFSSSLVADAKLS